MLVVHDLLDRLDHHDGIVHHDADGQHQAEQREHVDREAGQQQPGHGAHDGHRNGQQRNDGGAQAAQEEIDHDQHEHEGLDEGVRHQFYRGRDEARGVVGHRPLDLGRERFRQSVHLDPKRLGQLQRVGARAQVDADRHGRLAVQARFVLVVVLAELDARHIAHAHHRAIGLGANDDVAKLLGIDQAATGLHRECQALAVVAGRLADLADREVLVLLLHRVAHVGGRQPVLGQAVGVQPQAHGVGRSEQRHVADAGQALDLGEDLAVHQVGDVGGVEARVVRLQHQHLQDLRVGLVHAQARAQHLGRQQRLDALDAVAHVHGGEVEVGAGFEVDRQLHQPAGRTGALHVEQALGAVHLALQRRGDGGLQGLRAGAGVNGGDHHLRWRDRRVLLDGELPAGQQAHQHEDQGDDGRHDRALDEKSHGRPRFSVPQRRPPQTPPLPDPAPMAWG